MYSNEYKHVQIFKHVHDTNVSVEGVLYECKINKTVPNMLLQL